MSFLWFLSALFPVRRVLAQAIIRKIYINWIYGNYYAGVMPVRAGVSPETLVSIADELRIKVDNISYEKHSRKILIAITYVDALKPVT